MEPFTIDLLYLLAAVIMFPICLYISWKLARSRYASLAIFSSLSVVIGAFIVFQVTFEEQMMFDPKAASNIALALVAVTSIYIFSLTMGLYFCIELYKSYRSLLRGFLRHEPGRTQIEISLIRSKAK